MAKFAPDAMLDASLNYVTASTLLCVCSTQPTTYAEATATFKLADVVVDGTDFTIANGDTSGRKVTVAAQTGVPVDTSGDAQHIALVSTANSTLRYVTTCTLQALTAGNDVNTPAFDIEIADPA